MNVTEFMSYLEKNKVENKLVILFTNLLQEYEDYLMKLGFNLETSPSEKIVEYSENFVSEDENFVLNFLRAILHYANYSKNYEYITKVIDVSESYNAMDNLYIRVAKIYGESMRDEIFNDLVIPPLGTHPEKKPGFTKSILKRLEEKIGKNRTIDLLSPCLHGRPPDDIEGDKKLLNELGIDAFLKKKHLELVTRLEKHRDDGTLEFAQKIDNEIVNYVRDNPIIAHGIREENIIYVSKLPYQMRELLEAKSVQMKRFFLCYCPWVRGAIKDGTENEISDYFCNCSAGWYKLYWDQIFGQPVTVEPVATGLNGALECKFAIKIPDNILQKIIR